MSAGVGASGSGVALQRSNFFLDLPDEMLQVVLRYTTVEEGIRLMGTQKALHERLIGILLTNQRGYFSSLCKRMSSDFLFATEKFRQDRKEQGEEVLGEGKEPLTLKKLNEISKEFTGRMFQWYGRTELDYFYRPFFGKYSRASFFYPFQERIAPVLLELGIEFIRMRGIHNSVIRLAKDEKEDQEKRDLFIELAVAFSGVIEEEQAFHLINQITNERKREEVMNRWIEGVNHRAPFLQTEVFFDSITIVPLMKQLTRIGERGERIIDLLDKTIKHPNESIRKAVLFLFFRYWWDRGRRFEGTHREELVSKVHALIGTLREAERNVGVFGVLQGMIDSRFSHQYAISSDDYAACSLPYLKYQVDQKSASPSHIMETLREIMKHIEEHRRFDERLGRSNLYYWGNYAENDKYHLVDFFVAAIGRARTRREVSLIVESALKQAPFYPIKERARLVGYILSDDCRYLGDIRKIVEEKKGELIPEGSPEVVV